ncbi:hypothetical protein HYT02_03600 [Candidatus Gottesmanbacteria bacterium]|nr:hypothetical protein [Candidatus Gottesmanbacteria bacterium]
MSENQSPEQFIPQSQLAKNVENSVAEFPVLAEIDRKIPKKGPEFNRIFKEAFNK